MTDSGIFYDRMEERNRQPAFAGSFYPGNRKALAKKVDELFDNAGLTETQGRIRALIVPHAGYDFSGSVAAWGYKQLRDVSSYQNIFIMAASHRFSIDKASVYTAGNYVTPLGEVRVNREIAKNLTQSKHFIYHPEAHELEHSIEVQLPILQHFDNLPPVVPIVIASQSTDFPLKISKVLTPWFTPDNLFVISADFSHYPNYEDAIRTDEETANALCSGDPEIFKNILHQETGVQGLSTRMCAWTAALTLLYLIQPKSGYSFERIIYRNSGDSDYFTDKRRVVGYHAIALREPATESDRFLSDHEKNYLLKLSRRTLEEYFGRTSQLIPENKEVTRLTTIKSGAFVTLRSGNELRGCIGRTEPGESLNQLIPKLTIQSASEDYRFSPISADEIDTIRIEISLLSPIRKISDWKNIEVGKHGILIKSGSRQGLFLPEVAVEQRWDLETYLGRCSRDKAGIGWEGWKSADLYVFETIVIKEKD